MTTVLESQGQLSRAIGGNLSHARRDMFGIAASTLCAIHCAAMPFVVGFLPALGLSFLADAAFHQWMVGICLALALLAFVPGWKRHRRLIPGFIGLCGLGLISLAAFAGPADCCPTPHTEPAQVANAPMHAFALEQVQACEDACCAEEPAAVVAESAGIGGFMWLLMTPLGGALLVAGHLCNHRSSCRCTMCHSGRPVLTSSIE